MVFSGSDGRRVAKAFSGRQVPAADIKLDLAWQFHDRFGMMSVFKESVFQRLGAIDEQSAIEAMLFLGDPVAAAVPADKRNGRCKVARGRFDEFHVGIPFHDEASRFPVVRTFRCCWWDGMQRLDAGRWLDSCPGISAGTDMNSMDAGLRSHRSRIRLRREFQRGM